MLKIIVIVAIGLVALRVIAGLDPRNGTGTETREEAELKELRKAAAAPVVLAAPPAVQAAPAVTDHTDEERAQLLTVIAGIGAKILRGEMRDPSSFKLESVFVTSKLDVCYEYSAHNGFGGTNREYSVMPRPYTVLDYRPSTWNRRCADKTGIDETSAVIYRLGWRDDRE